MTQSLSLPDVGLHRVCVETWGCQMNVADSERILALLLQAGVARTTTLEEADLIVLNTCNIREKARHKVVSRLGELRALKETRPHLLLAVGGCVAQMEADELARSLPFVDLVFGPDQVERLPELLWEIRQKSGHPLIEAEFDTTSGYSISHEAVDPWFDEAAHEVSRFVNIIKGCNNFCTYCVVPYARGREKSRPVEQILNEVRYYTERGVREIVLLGQNVNSYGLDASPEGEPKEAPFLELLRQVAAMSGVSRLRFVTSNPHDFPTGLPQLFVDLPNLCDQLHLPVQAGSNRVLQSMNRKYTRETYLARLSAVRAVRPAIAFSTDIIVGFPGETEEDFRQTMDLVATVKYASIFAFKYSRRKGTPAADFADQVPEAVKERRLQELLALQKEETLRQNLAEIGQLRKVLVLYHTKDGKAKCFGRTFAGRLVRITENAGMPGDELMVRITAANVTALEGVALAR